jgi:hypothetical protein
MPPRANTADADATTFAGLMLAAHHAWRFFFLNCPSRCPEIVNSAHQLAVVHSPAPPFLKTTEIRPFSVSQRKAGELVYIFETSAGRDQAGPALLCCIGSMVWRSTKKVPKATFMEHFSAHRCALNEASSMFAQWKRTKGTDYVGLASVYTYVVH